MISGAIAAPLGFPLILVLETVAAGVMSASGIEVNGSALIVVPVVGSVLGTLVSALLCWAFALPLALRALSKGRSYPVSFFIGLPLIPLLGSMAIEGYIFSCVGGNFILGALYLMGLSAVPMLGVTGMFSIVFLVIRAGWLNES